MIDLLVAEEAKREGMERAADGAQSWLAEARPVLRDIAASVDSFTTDRLEWELNRRGIEPPEEPRAYGALMRDAARSGWIEKTDRVVPSVIARNHRRPKAVWRSALRQ